MPCESGIRRRWRVWRPFVGDTTSTAVESSKEHPRVATTDSLSTHHSGSEWLRGRFAGWIFATDHKRIGILWLAIAGVSAAIGGLLAFFTAIQTATVDSGFVGKG